LGYAPWADRYHYDRVGTFAEVQLRKALASDEAAQVAWAAVKDAIALHRLAGATGHVRAPHAPLGATASDHRQPGAGGRGGRCVLSRRLRPLHGGWANPTQNPHRFEAAWGYITDTPGSGLLQLGARYYWPELGRFIQQDPVGDGVNWYVYGESNPLLFVGPEGEQIYAPWNPESTWYHVFTNDEGVWSAFPQGAAAVADFANPFGDPYADAGVYNPCESWVGGSHVMAGIGLAAGGAAAVGYVGPTLAARMFVMGGTATHWGPRAMEAVRAGDWVMMGGRTPLNYLATLIPGRYPYTSSLSPTFANGALRHPLAEERPYCGDFWVFLARES